MQAVIPVMKQQGGGAIINISSVAGHIPLPYHAGYSATKFALNAIGKAAGVELKKDGYPCADGVSRVTCRLHLRKTRSADNEVKTVRPTSVRGITAERVARATLEGYLKKKREVIVPWTMHVPVKLYQLFPAMVERDDGQDGEVAASALAPTRPLIPPASLPSPIARGDFRCAGPRRCHRASIFLASSDRSAFASVCAAIK